jgi:predicted RNA-binding Zn ribbon-like protein
LGLVESRPIDELDLCGGDAALDFVNTLGGLREGPWDDEWLLDYRHLAAWSRHAGLLAEPSVDRLLERAAARPDLADRALRDAITLREALYRVFAAHARREPAAPRDLATVATAYRDALANARLVPELQRHEWAWEVDEDLRRPLWPVAHAAVQLLRSERLGRLRQCGHCRWLFLDASKNRSRRWCSMAHCGSDAKVRRARARRHATRRTTPR